MVGGHHTTGAANHGHSEPATAASKHQSERSSSRPLVIAVARTISMRLVERIGGLW